MRISKPYRWVVRGALFLGASLGFTGCNNARGLYGVFDTGSALTTNIPYLGQIQYKKNNVPVATVAQQMTMVNGKLFVTGKPFAFMGLSALGSSSQIDFAAERLINYINPQGIPQNLFSSQVWEPDALASNALTVIGSGIKYGFSSGPSGLSVIYIPVSQAVQSSPADVTREVKRYTSVDSIYGATAVLGSQLFGFASDKVYERDLSSLATATSTSQINLPVVSQTPYNVDRSSVCCQRAAVALTFAGQVTIALAMDTKLWVYHPQQINGKWVLGNILEYASLNAKALAVSAKYLYVLHVAATDPKTGAPLSTSPSGIYAFRRTDGGPAAYFALTPTAMAVAADDSVLYTYEGTQTIRMYSPQF